MSLPSISRPPLLLHETVSSMTSWIILLKRLHYGLHLMKPAFPKAVIQLFTSPHSLAFVSSEVYHLCHHISFHFLQVHEEHVVPFPFSSPAVFMLILNKLLRRLHPCELNLVIHSNVKILCLVA